jgi:hypothetical protein
VLALKAKALEVSGERSALAAQVPARKPPLLVTEDAIKTGRALAARSRHRGRSGEISTTGSSSSAGRRGGMSR